MFELPATFVSKRHDVIDKSTDQIYGAIGILHQVSRPGETGDAYIQPERY